MKEFIDYLSKQIEAGGNDAARLEKEGRRDEADFAKVRTNIYEVCRTVTNALAERIRATHPDKDIRYVSDMALIAETVDAETEEGDLVIVMGAGDVYKVGHMMVKEEEA